MAENKMNEQDIEEYGLVGDQEFEKKVRDRGELRTKPNNQYFFGWCVVVYITMFSSSSYSDDRNKCSFWLHYVLIHLN